MEFYQVLYDTGWIAPEFDWVGWQVAAWRYVESPCRVETADAGTFRKLLTTHVRSDRFCEGHPTALFENGHVSGLLRRLRVIRAEMDQTDKGGSGATES
jgi:hypothetical protein